MHYNNLLSAPFLVENVWCTSFFFKNGWWRSFFIRPIWLCVLFTFLIHFKRTSWIINNLIFTNIWLLFVLFETYEFFFWLINILSAHLLLRLKLLIKLILVLRWFLIAIEPIYLGQLSFICVLYNYQVFIYICFLINHLNDFFLIVFVKISIILNIIINLILIIDFKNNHLRMNLRSFLYISIFIYLLNLFQAALTHLINWYFFRRFQTLISVALFKSFTFFLLKLFFLFNILNDWSV